MDIMQTLQYMKPDIKVLVWDNDIDQIEYNETETFRPSKEDILAVNQDLVNTYYLQQEENQKATTIADLKLQLLNIQEQLNSMS